jgi:hypothetical protein
MALPGRAKQPNIKQKAGKKGAADQEEVEPQVDEFSFDQMKSMGKELKDLSEGDSKQQLREIQKLRDAEALEAKKKKNKKKTDNRVNVEELDTVTEARKGGLPEHIAKLPLKHPIRVRWEKGFRQREDGTWYKMSAEEGEDHISLSHEKKHALFLIPLIVLGIVVVFGGNWYANQLTDTRKEIVKTIKFKGLSKHDPITKKKLDRAYKSHWLPELTVILDGLKKVPRNFSSFGDNSEKGSYMQHIKKHNKEFDPEEAMRWRTRVIRKPSQ